jgi:hypothetical protein
MRLLYYKRLAELYTSDRIATARRLELILAGALLRCKRSAAVPNLWLQYGRRITVAKPDRPRAA